MPATSPIEPRARELLRGMAGTTGNDAVAYFEQLYDLLQARVYGLSLRVIRDPDLAQESAQEAWLLVWDRAGSYDPRRGSAVAWIISVAHARAVDVVRHNEALRARQSAAGRRDLALSPQTPPELQQERSERHAVALCLGALSDKQREAILLSYYEGLTQRQVAQRVGAGLPAVKSRIRDGLTALRRCLDQ
ncbi:sigma-70 family RNA polymerase sigma factor [Corynebacterium heidelbergense]|uniref:RNA polymerase subunit sigma n=1 Tax=Corynebacterium heidelbergense TaxID=2055947 RepID=A0A364V5J9_9CORY|nr:sigma-70 family RNA polymerase sigma factor [Corynebacterium heidelbergense]RAV31920.1 RNA polymerase subunit sigma [Corynebacterium heidelbergense]